MRINSGNKIFDRSVIILQIIVLCFMVFNFFSLCVTNKEFQVYEQVAREIYEFDGTGLYDNPKGLYIKKTPTGIIVAKHSILGGKLYCTLENGELKFERIRFILPTLIVLIAFTVALFIAVPMWLVFIFAVFGFTWAILMEIFERLKNKFVKKE